VLLCTDKNDTNALETNNIYYTYLIYTSFYVGWDSLSFFSLCSFTFYRIFLRIPSFFFANPLISCKLNSSVQTH